MLGSSSILLLLTLAIRAGNAIPTSLTGNFFGISGIDATFDYVVGDLLNSFDLLIVRKGCRRRDFWSYRGE